MIFKIVLGLAFLVNKNKKNAELTKKKMLDRVNEIKKNKQFQDSEYMHHPIANSILNLLENFNKHDKIEKKLSNKEILSIEKKLELKLPKSYKIFLKYFGDGGYWVYNQSIDSIENYSWLSDYRKKLGNTIKLGNRKIEVKSLLCLMTEDSNGGAWCWLTSEKEKDNEWPLAYYFNNELHYEVENFTEWLKVLTNAESEVIMSLDIDYKLGLG